MSTGRGIVKSLARSMATAASSQNASRSPTAIVLLNMGGPPTLQDVGPFLHNLFSDKDLIPLPFQSRLAPWIARRRTPKVTDQYAKIGGGSPIGSWTDKQGQAMVKVLDEISPETAPHRHYIAFRYAPPLTETALDKIFQDGVKRAVAFTQYPQWSCSTTGSSLNDLVKQLKQRDPEGKVEWSVIDRWPTHAGLIEAFADRIRTRLNSYPAEVRDRVVILFSAHSLPLSVVSRGDPYTTEVAATVYAVMEKIGHTNPYRLAWQSKVGPSQWLTPDTQSTIEALGKAGHKEVMLVPIAFTSDHIETLYELDLEYGHLAKEVGITNLTRVESLNDSPIFTRAMADIVASHLRDGVIASKQFELRCPGCVNEKCGQTKEYFVGKSNVHL
ncbi:ferrochelatase [Gonapodya prolifera JEL478]|uniref:Ferrochelatase n=1 Tax=Gonapodya prolifera (strain JEL478) TaxID=1344416 RepID=A0A139AB46_GONPJ|nr:ferrochelatase [Gonapodya prolifera JEL478]|eukprot:KXS13613.1 ferrochelatase [Gonapodya prolifera JEL478]